MSNIVTTMQLVKDYLDTEWNLWKDVEPLQENAFAIADPAHHVYSNALELWSQATSVAEFIQNVQAHQQWTAQATTAYPDEAWRKEAVNYYQIILDTLEERHLV